eukprot:3933584-Rhodomonas_salina.3
MAMTLTRYGTDHGRSVWIRSSRASSRECFVTSSSPSASRVALRSSQSERRVGFIATTMRPVSSKASSSPAYRGANTSPMWCLEVSGISSQPWRLLRLPIHDACWFGFADPCLLPPRFANLVMQELHDALIRPLLRVSRVQPSDVVRQLPVHSLDWHPHSPRRRVRSPQMCHRVVLAVPEPHISLTAHPLLELLVH